VIYAAIVVVWASLVFYAWRSSKAPAFVPDELEAEVGTGAPSAEDSAR
jgi:hypothetical protein